MEIGAFALESRGSGGARLAVAEVPAPGSDDLVLAGRRLSHSLVARSSTMLESKGQWAGAFTSYVGIPPEQLPKAIVGCWASAFSVDSLARQRAEGVRPGSIGMAVLVQPALRPETGGGADIEPDGSIVVRGVKGPPGPLLQGWVSGFDARLGPHGWVGDELIELAGTRALDEIRESLLRANGLLGVNRCEWATDDGLWLLQLGKINDVEPSPATPAGITQEMIPTIRAVMAAPGPLGEELVLPWAIAGDSTLTEPVRGGVADLRRARELSGRLTSAVWGLPPDQAMSAAQDLLVRLRGPEPAPALKTIRDLRLPDHGLAAELIGHIDGLRVAMADRGAVANPMDAWRMSTGEIEAVLAGNRRPPPSRVGTGSWEPLVAAVVLAYGARHSGVPASGGIGAGLRSDIPHLGVAGGLPHRRVVTAPEAVPALSQLLWDSAGLVTRVGSPAAHVFESARSLGVPAVSGVTLGEGDEQIVAVDGYAGVVAVMSLSPRP